MRIRFVAALCAASLFIFVFAAVAQEEEPTSFLERRLIERLSRTSFNEALDSYHDLALVWQIVEGQGADAGERAQWLRNHSRCVNGRLTQDQARARPGNCHWTRNLTPDGRRPRGFHDCRDRDGDGETDVAPGHTAAHPCDGAWSRIRPRWLTHVANTRAFVLGEDDYRPCPETPHTWDGVRYGRDAVAPRGGNKRILDCAVPYTQIAGEEGLHNFAVCRDGGAS